MTFEEITMEKKVKEEWYFILDHDASFGHYHLCPVCGQSSPTTSRICPCHSIYYVFRGTNPDDYIGKGLA